MVALDVKGSGLAFVGIERTARDTVNFFVVDGQRAVTNNRYCSSHQGDVKGFPFARLAGEHGAGRKTSVDRSHRALWRLGSCLFIFELEFIPSAKIEAAVGILGAVYFEVP